MTLEESPLTLEAGDRGCETVVVASLALRRHNIIVDALKNAHLPDDQIANETRSELKEFANRWTRAGLHVFVIICI